MITPLDSYTRPPAEFASDWAREHISRQAVLDLWGPGPSDARFAERFGAVVGRNGLKHASKRLWSRRSAACQGPVGSGCGGVGWRGRPQAGAKGAGRVASTGGAGGSDAVGRSLPLGLKISQGLYMSSSSLQRLTNGGFSGMIRNYPYRLKLTITSTFSLKPFGRPDLQHTTLIHGDILHVYLKIFITSHSRAPSKSSLALDYEASPSRCLAFTSRFRCKL